MIKQVIWSSMIDYPNHISTVIFFDECNLNCEYCYNKELKKMKELNFKIDILPKLIERKDLINHIILSGGECTYDSQFINILDILILNQFVVGIHTNGTNYKVLSNNIDKISYVGIDVKSNKEKYMNITGSTKDINDVYKCINLCIESKVDYQCRTTIYPKVLNKYDVLDIAQQVNNIGVREYNIQQYQPIGSAEIVEQYTIEHLKEIQTECNKIIKTNLKYK